MMKHNPNGLVGIRCRLFVWFNIFVQIVFPMAATFLPSSSVAKNESRFLEPQGNGYQLATRVYTLDVNESTRSVAAQNNMSVDSLRRLNQLRVFANGFDNLQPGDELDVPLTPLPAVHWEDKEALEKNTKPIASQEKKLAGLALQAGSFMSSNPNGDAVTSIFRGMANNEVGSSIQQWLSQFGTAQVQLDVDKNFSLKNSQIDLLVPLYEQKDKLVFSQGSLHRTDDRMQSNLGLGYRWFNNDYMLGVNTFFDYDLSNNHARMGGGGEYWRDFLKLGVNGYQRLTNWKDSKDVEDYQDRPANGWDIRAEAYLPNWPQLGGSLIYEKYYGNEVALFGKDNRQSNPHAITVGVSYTPFPLITFNLEQIKGSAGSSENRVGLQVNYQFGTSLDTQLSGDSVKAMRSLQGQRYDLVDRNNNIILEYKKQDVITLRTAEQVNGKSLEKHPLGTSVNTKYGLDRIDWDAGKLLATGGRIVQESPNQYSVILPSFQTHNLNDNTYTISAVAYDVRGNKSNISKTQILVENPPGEDVQSGALESDKDALKANGADTAKLTLTVKDAHENGIANLSGISLVQGGTPVANVTISAVSESPKKDGTYTATLSGTGVGKVTLVPKVGDKTFDKISTAVTLTALSGEDVQSGALESDKDALKANGADTAKL
ncbi:inverse autotransporter beta domain-containing protein, partial [Serratia liquefaciens]|uniref:inverse autotransporter beta domain-containing protein n=1 Tax=Serratia liquefaciens TaxID=614 RepID=UPI0032E00478